MDAIIVCPAGENVVLVKGGVASWYGITCSGGSVPATGPISMGLGDLAWADANLLVASLLTACVLATGWNILAKMFYRG